MSLVINSGYKSLNLYFNQPTNAYYIDDITTSGRQQLQDDSVRSDIDNLAIWLSDEPFSVNLASPKLKLVYAGIFQSSIVLDRINTSSDPEIPVYEPLLDNTQYYLRYAITSKIDPTEIVPTSTEFTGTTLTSSDGKLKDWIVKTANYTAIAGDRIIADTRNGSFTITLPANPSVGASVIVTDGWDFSQNNLIIGRNGSLIINEFEVGEASDIDLDVMNTTYEFIYTGGTLGWTFTSTVGPKGESGNDALLLTLEYKDDTFVYDNATTVLATTPNSIVINAIKQNLNGTVLFEAKAYDASSVELGTVTLTGTGDTRTLTAANFNTVTGVADKLSIRYVTITASIIAENLNETFSDSVTIRRIDNGSDAIVHQMDNPSHIVPASTLGVVSSYSGAAAQGRVFRGAVNETMSWTLSKEDSNGLTTTLVKPVVISNSGTIASITGTGPWTASITDLETVSGLAVGDTISALENNTGRLYGGNPTSVVIQSINSAQKSLVYVVTGGTTPIAGPIGALAKGHNYYILTATNLASNVDTATSVVTATKNGSSYKQTFSLAKSKDGTVFAILDLSNDNVNLATEYDGTGGDYSLVTTNVTMSVGNINVLPLLTGLIITPSAGVTFSYTKNGGSPVAGLTSAATIPLSPTVDTLSLAVTNLTNDNGKLTVSATYILTNYTTEFTFSKNKAGPDGTPATIYSIEADSELVYNPNTESFSPSSIIFSAYSKTGNNAKALYTDTNVKIRLECSHNNSTWVAIGSDLVASTRTLATNTIPQTITIGSTSYTTKYLRYSLVKIVDSVTTILDRETDVISTDGTNSSTITVDIENDTHNIPFTTAGVGDYAYSGTKIQVFDNNTELVYTNSQPSIPGTWTIESYTASGITPSPAVFGLPVPVGGQKYATIDQHSGMSTKTATITYSIKAISLKGVTVTGLLGNQTFTKVDGNAIFRIVGAGSITKSKSGIYGNVTVKGQKVEDGTTSDYGSLTYQVIPAANGVETSKSSVTYITVPVLATVSYPSVSKHGTAFSWGISGGVPNDTWYVQVTGGFTARVPSSGTNTLNSVGAASFTNGDWSGITGGINNKGSVTLTFYFGSGAIATISHTVYGSSETAPTSTTVTKQAAVNGTGIKVRLYASTSSSAVLDEASINITEDGTDATTITVDVDNDTHDMPADSAGTVVSSGYDYSGTKIQVFASTTELQYVKYSAGQTLSDDQWRITSRTASGITPAGIPDVVSGEKYATIGSHSNMTAPTATITYFIEAKPAGKNTVVGLLGTQTFAKVNRTALYRITNAESVVISKDGTINQITINTQKIDGTTITSPFGYITATLDNATEVAAGNRIQVSNSGYTTAALATTKKVTIRLYETNNSTTVLDTAEIKVIRDGIDGLGGASVTYTNDAHLVPVSGTINWTSSGGLIRVYEGTSVLQVYSNSILLVKPIALSTDYPAEANKGTYNLNITKVSGDNLTVGNLTANAGALTDVNLAQWAGTLTQPTVYRITAYIRTTTNITLVASTDLSLVPTKDSVIYSLNVSPSLLSKIPDVNTYIPNKLNIKLYRTIGNETPALYTPTKFTVSYSTDGSNYTGAADTTSANSFDYTIPNQNIKAIKVQAFVGTTQVDQEIVTVSEAAKGDPGDPGAPGAPAKDVSLSTTGGNITKSGSTYSPATIPITVTPINITSPSYAWEITGGTLNTATGATVTVTPTGNTNVVVTVKVSETISGSTTQILSKQVIFAIVTNGVDGLTGKRVATGYVYYTAASDTKPGTPTGTYNFNTGQVTSLTSGWSNNAPLFETATTAKKYWSASFSAIESGPGTGTTAAGTVGGVSYTATTMSFTVQQAIGFSGVVTFTSLSSPGETTIDGGNIKTGYINAARIEAGSIDAKISTIDNSQIGNFIKSTDFDGTINETNGTITADGTKGWAIGKGNASNSGYAVFNKIKVRGDIICDTLTANNLITTSMIQNNQLSSNITASTSGTLGVTWYNNNTTYGYLWPEDTRGIAAGPATIIPTSDNSKILVNWSAQYYSAGFEYNLIEVWRFTNTSGTSWITSRLYYAGSGPDVTNTASQANAYRIQGQEIASGSFIDTTFEPNKVNAYFLIVGNMASYYVYVNNPYLSLTELKR
jgi:hypothetical protein